MPKLTLDKQTVVASVVWGIYVTLYCVEVARGVRQDELLLKPIPTCICAILVSRQLSREYNRFILCGYACSVVGDIFIALHVYKYFIVGAYWFFAAHLLYICAFRQCFQRPNYRTLVPVLAIMILFLCYYYYHATVPLFDKLECIGYFVVLCMNFWITTCSRRTLYQRPFQYSATLGMLFFVLSDVILVNKIYLVKGHEAVLEIVLDVLYFIAQFCIGLSTIHLSFPSKKIE